MPGHWLRCFLVSPCYLQDTMPCQWSECCGFERAFLPYTPYCWFQGFPGSRQFNLKVSRASCWSSKNSSGTTISLNRNTPQKSYSGRSYLRVTAGRLIGNPPLMGFRTLFTIGQHFRSLMVFPFDHRAIQSVIN